MKKRVGGRQRSTPTDLKTRDFDPDTRDIDDIAADEAVRDPVIAWVPPQAVLPAIATPTARAIITIPNR